MLIQDDIYKAKNYTTTFYMCNESIQVIQRIRFILLHY